ncbi:hypothetical protein WR25_04086 [Diploscapter pachys]|uniref:Uncharacterized protein n=1 Tax=Diploscapter pachys TaxID=2018661 RepID=A0A2A2J5T6_9BILA|nr:hypothetical protein WR25_04086 [Diploscapter pachys]
MAFCRLRLKSNGLWRGPKDPEKKEQNKKKTVRSQIDIRREGTERGRETKKEGAKENEKWNGMEWKGEGEGKGMNEWSSERGGSQRTVEARGRDGHQYSTHCLSSSLSPFLLSLLRDSTQLALQHSNTALYCALHTAHSPLSDSD